MSLKKHFTKTGMAIEKDRHVDRLCKGHSLKTDSLHVSKTKLFVYGNLSSSDCLKVNKSFLYKTINWTKSIYSSNRKPHALMASREQTFDPRPKWVLVPVFFAPGTRETFSPGWWIQPVLKVPA